MFELLPKGLYIDFVGKRKAFAIASALVTAVSFALFFVVGPNWSIDFTGGTEVEMHFAQPTTIAEVRTVLGTLEISEDSIQQVGEAAESTYVVRLQGTASANPQDVAAVKAALAVAFGSDWIDEIRVDDEVGSRASIVYKGDQIDTQRIIAALASIPGCAVQGSPEENTFYVRLPGVAEGMRKSLDAGLAGRGLEIDRADSVGPKVGGSLRVAGITAVIWSVILHLIYVSVRFELAFAPGAILCLVHDVAITCGLLVLLRLDFGLSTVSALLTLTGYSLNDTIVTYDRIRENSHRYRRKNFGELINDSINQTLARTLMTSGATALAMIPFLFWGGPVLQEFAVVMLMGMVIGVYSSIYVAAPLTMILTENQDRIRLWVGLRPPAVALDSDEPPAGRRPPRKVGPEANTRSGG